MADEKKRDDDQAPSLAPQLATFAGVGTAVHLAKNKGEDRPLKAIRRAEEMRVKGAKRSEIHRETSKMLEWTPYAGVTYGADKQPRFEIDDSMASARVAGVPAGGKGFLTDALHHPELYDAVPSAKHLTVQRSPTNDSGITGSGIVVGDKHFGGRIGGREIMKKSAKGPMLHEIQHHIQDIEGFAEGGTPADFAKKYPNNPEKQKLAYTMLAGEQEAEMTRKRADMTAAQRRATMPQPDVPVEHQIVQFDARAKAKVDMTSIADSARAAYRALMNRDVADGKSIRFRKVDPSQVQADADTFQFKSGGDAAGVTDRLKGVKTWDPVAAGKTVIWERADGQMFIGDGHQRLGLAKRLQGAGQNVELDAYVMREKDGWSPRDVRAYAAVKNMKEGSGTSLDMAKVVRERPDLVNDSLPLSDAKVRDAISLSKLSPEAFNMVVGGVVKPEHAAAVGSAVGDTSRHAGLLAEMAKAEVASAQQARLYVGQAMAAGTYQETTGSLFGEETQVRSLLAERTKVLDKAIQSLKSDKKIFGLLEREAGQIEAAGNKLAHETNAARAEGAGRTAELVERLAMHRGPVSEMLDRAAAAVADGKTPSVAAREFVRSVHDTLKAGGMAGLTGDAPKPAPAPVDPNQVNMFGGSGERPGWSDAAREASAEVRADNAKGPKMKKTRAPKASKPKAMMDSELPPRLKVGKMSDAAKSKWEKDFRDIPQDDAERRLAERKKGEKVGQSKRTKMMADDGGKKIVGHDWEDIKRAQQGGRLNKAVDLSRPAKSPPTADDMKLLQQYGGSVQALKDAGFHGSADRLADFDTKPTDMFGGPSTKDKINAKAREMEAKGRTGDPANHGLFSSAKDQTDLVDRAKEKSAVTKASIVAAHKKGMARIEAKNARAEAKAARKARVDAEEVRHLQSRGVMSKDGVTYSAEQAERDRVAAGTKRAGDTATDRYSRAMSNHPKRSMATATSVVTIKPVVVDGKTTGEHQIVEDHYVGRGKEQRKVGTTAYTERYSSYESAAKFMDGLPDPAPTSLPTKGKQAAAVEKIKGELREMFSRSPDGKQRNTKGELLPSSEFKSPAVEGLRAGDMEMLKRTIKSGVSETVSAHHAALLKSATNAQLSELDTFAHEARKGSARTDVDFNRIGAFRQQIRDLARVQSDAAAKAQIEGKGPAGWSDAARAASAEVRAADAKPVSAGERALKAKAMSAKRKPEPKPRMKDADVKHLLKQGLVTREDVKTSPTMGALKDKARASAANMLRDRGMLDTGTKRDQVIEEWVNSGKPKTVDAKAYDMVKDSVKQTEKTTSEWQVGSGAKGKKTWHAYRTTKWVEDGTPRSVTEPLTGPSGKPRQFASKAAAEKATSGLRGTQNAANLEAIIANKKANANPDLAEAAKSAGVNDLHGQMQEVFGPRKDHIPGVGNPQESYWTYKTPPTPTVADLPKGAFSGTDKEFSSLSPGMRREIARTAKALAAKAPEVPHQMTPQGQVDRYVNRMIAAGSTKSPEALKAEFAAKSAAKPAGRGRKALGLLVPVAIGTAMLAASNQAKAAGADARGQSKEAVKAGVESGAVMAGFTIGAGAAIKGLVRAGMTVAKAAPVVQGAFMAYGAISEGIHAYKEGGSAKDVALAAGKGAWDMSLPGMVVNTTKDAAAAIKERRDLAATPNVAGLQRFNKVAADYKAKAEAARSPMVAPVEPSDGDNRPRGWANAKVQAAAQAAKGRQFSGVFKDGHLQ